MVLISKTMSLTFIMSNYIRLQTCWNLHHGALLARRPTSNLFHGGIWALEKLWSKHISVAI